MSNMYETQAREARLSYERNWPQKSEQLKALLYGLPKPVQKQLVLDPVVPDPVQPTVDNPEESACSVTRVEPISPYSAYYKTMSLVGRFQNPPDLPSPVVRSGLIQNPPDLPSPVVRSGLIQNPPARYQQAPQVVRWVQTNSAPVRYEPPPQMARPAPVLVYPQVSYMPYPAPQVPQFMQMNTAPNRYEPSPQAAPVWFDPRLYQRGVR
jgi:hypothetical protein